MVRTASLWHRERWADAIWASGLPASARLVALAFADHAGDQATAWVALARLAARTGLSRRSCQRAIDRLVEDGWLTEHEAQAQHKSPVFVLTFPPSMTDAEPARGATVTPLTAPRGATVSARGAKSASQGRHSDTSPNYLPNYSPDARGRVPSGEAAPPEAARSVTGGGEAPTNDYPRHEHDERARSLLGELVESRGLPLDAERLLALAYAHGRGDPWHGYRVIRDRLDAVRLNGVRDRRAYLLTVLSRPTTPDERPTA
jgi:hypothetical protein